MTGRDVRTAYGSKTLSQIRDREVEAFSASLAVAADEHTDQDLFSH